MLISWPVFKQALIYNPYNSVIIRMIISWPVYKQILIYNPYNSVIIRIISWPVYKQILIYNPYNSVIIRIMISWTMYKQFFLYNPYNRGIIWMIISWPVYKQCRGKSCPQHHLPPQPPNYQKIKNIFNEKKSYWAREADSQDEFVHLHCLFVLLQLIIPGDLFFYSIIMTCSSHSDNL